MSHNYLANYASPQLAEIGQLTFAVDTTTIGSVNSCFTDELVVELMSSGGMTGQKYRDWAIKTIGLGLISELGNTFTSRNLITKNLKITAVAIAIGSLLGTTGSKKTLMKTMGTTLDGRATQSDALGLAWRIVKTSFKTYTNEANTDSKMFPSVKFCPSLPEYALLGVCVLLTRSMNLVQILGALWAPMMEWPDLLKKQWVGNFALNPEFQMEHMVWERTFWNTEIASTNNESNKSFKKGFVAKFYDTTARDKFLILSTSGQYLMPEIGGYTKALFVKAVLIICAEIIATRGVTYRSGGNIMSTNQNTAAVAPAQSTLRLAAITVIPGLTPAQIESLDSMTVTALPADIAAAEGMSDLVTSVRAQSFTPP